MAPEFEFYSVTYLFSGENSFIKEQIRKNIPCVTWRYWSYDIAGLFFFISIATVSILTGLIAAAWPKNERYCQHLSKKPAPHASKGVRKLLFILP